MEDQVNEAPSFAAFATENPGAVLRLVEGALAKQAARWAVLLMSFALYAGCLYRPSWVRLATASAFTLGVHIPLWINERKRR